MKTADIARVSAKDASLLYLTRKSNSLPVQNMTLYIGIHVVTGNGTTSRKSKRYMQAHVKS